MHPRVGYRTMSKRRLRRPDELLGFVATIPSFSTISMYNTYFLGTDSIFLPPQPVCSLGYPQHISFLADGTLS